MASYELLGALYNEQKGDDEKAIELTNQSLNFILTTKKNPTINNYWIWMGGLLVFVLIGGIFLRQKLS